MEINMTKAKLIKALCITAALAFMTTGTYAAGAPVLKIDGKQVPEALKEINGKQYVLVDSLKNNLEGISITGSGGNVEINTDTNKISNIIKQVSPSVVGIIGKLKESSYDYSDYTDNLIFGTGVIYRSDGYIVTNAHVVKDMDSIVVVLSDSKAYKARLKAIDESLDLAVIKIDKGGLKPAVFGNMSSVDVGQEVVAIGTPQSFNLRNSATRGIISGMNRSTDGEYRFIQSDAAINGGNSGGPLVNMKGQVIGINSVKLVGFGVEGLNFSIPVDTVRYAIDHFERFGKIKRPYLGVVFSESIAAQYGLPSAVEGLTVREIKDGSPALSYDIQPDDKLVTVNGVKVNSIIDYNEEMKKYLPGDKAALKLVRDGRQVVVNVVFGEK